MVYWCIFLYMKNKVRIPLELPANLKQSFLTALNKAAPGVPLNSGLRLLMNYACYAETKELHRILQYAWLGSEEKKEEI